MNTQFASRRALRTFVTGASLAAFGFFALPATSQATPVTTWTKTAGGTVISGLNTASPVFGNGSAGSANGYQLNAALPSTYTLAAVGDSITFSGAAVFNLSAGTGSDQFRFGVFDTDGSSDNNGWLGYFASNSGINPGNPNGRLWERKDGHDSAYFNNGQGSDERQASAGTPPSTTTVSTFLAGTYNFSMALTRTADGLSVAWSIVGTDETNYSISGVYADATPNTYAFNRVGFFTGGGLNADQINFSNLDVTFTSAIPEPATWATLAACFALGVACLRRRARV